MKRRTIDIAFSIGGTIFAVLLLVLGFVLKQQADFADQYVTRELSAQKIFFTPAAFLSDAEKGQDGGQCLVNYGTTDGDDKTGQQMTTGAQAECYARYYIALHMKESADEAGFPDETYATMGKYVRPGSGDASIPDQIQAAKDAGDDAKVEELTAKLDEAKGLRTTLQQGETLRGLLLTVYGFSVFGEKAELAQWVCWIGGILLLILSIMGFAHAATKGAKEHVVE